MTRHALARPAALLAVLSLTLTGCALSSEGAASSDGASGERATLTFWSYYQGAQGEWLADRVAAFEADNPDVDIEVVETTGDTQDQRLLASVATGGTPDLFINNIVVDFPTLVAGGVTADLTPYWEDYAEREEYPDNAAWTNDDKVYNLLPYTNLLGMYYNADLLAEHGVDSPPQTLDELEAALEAVTAGGDQGVALSGAPTVEGAWLFAPQLLGEGVNYCNLSGAPVDAAFERLGRWAELGYVPKAAATWDQNASWQQFLSGRYAFGFNGNWQLGNVADADFEYGTTQFPAPEGGSSVVYPGGEGFGIGATSEHKDLAWQFLEEAVLSPEAGETIFATAGSIPVRADVAQTLAEEGDEYVAPFLAAAQTTGQWPDNTETAAAQTALGTAVSGVISGQLAATQGSAQAQADVAEALEAGGGTCE